MMMARPDKSDPFLARIHVEDFPDIDPDTEDGKDQLTSLAYAASRKNPSLTHFLFMQHGEQIGEMFIRSLFDEVH